ncbi:MAG TPA: rRNA maturation RNase YbeY [Lachnospiraceae bacterium]|nr:rRNA maturation RNase YbeY [Lachnospiraceae bacterium]
MTVTIENEYIPEYKEDMPALDYQKVAEDVLSGFLDATQCPYEAEVNILITGNDAIREINREQRGIDSITDVLSFPLHEYSQPAAFDELDEDSFDDFDPESGELLLGDIVLCLPRIREQAVMYGHSFLREYAFLIVHSLLHLVGYDHMSRADEERMTAMQDTIMNDLGITREGGKEKQL